MKRIFTLGFLVASMAVNAWSTQVVGYSDGNQGTNTQFRTSTGTTGLAVKFPKEKLQTLKGCVIKSVEIAVGSKMSTNNEMTLFIAPSLDGTPAVSEVHSISRANSWREYTLNQPYTITGDEPALYVGYKMEIGKTYMPLSADFSVQMEGVTFALYDDQWRDVAELNVGQGNIRLVLDRDPATTDMIVKPLSFNDYYREGVPYEFFGQMFNFGTTPVESFKVKLQIGSGEPQYYDIDETIEPGGSYDFKLPEYTANETGELDVAVSVEEVNGKADSDPSDNAASTKVFFYPADMERTIMIEGFTGQACGNCPTGHRTLSTVLADWEKDASNPEIIEIMHHAGYYPDFFTMAEDSEYTVLYGGSTFAPAFMVNRINYPTSSDPVINASAEELTTMLSLANAAKPYVSLNLQSDYDPATRKLDVSVEVYTHQEVPAEIKTLNVVLCQNGLVNYQSGAGSDYTHSHVFRGALTGNAWGVMLPLVPGTTDTYTVSYTIPEKIHSSYWTDEKMASIDEAQKPFYDIAAVPEDMYIVAYASVFDEMNIGKRYILNSAMVNLGESKEQGGFAGVETPAASEEVAPVVRVSDGYVTVDGDSSCQIEIYNLAGAMVANGHVSGGMFVVRVVTEAGKVYVTKVMAR